MTADLQRCLRWGLCFTCGEKLTKWRATVLTPMDAVRGEAGFPPSHTECARTVAKESDQTCVVWICRTPSTAMLGQRGDEAAAYFQLPPADALEWYTFGRTAFRDEAIMAIKAAIPALLMQCNEDPAEFEALGAKVRSLVPTLPRASSPGVRACVACQLNTNDQQVLGCTRVECPLFGE